MAAVERFVCRDLTWECFLCPHEQVREFGTYWTTGGFGRRARAVRGRPGVVGSRANSPGHHTGTCGRVAVLNGRVRVGAMAAVCRCCSVSKQARGWLRSTKPRSIIYRHVQLATLNPMAFGNMKLPSVLEP